MAGLPDGSVDVADDGGPPDPELAAIVKRLNPPAPWERIVGTDILATVANHPRVTLAGKRVARLACGHRIVTAAFTKARCPDCHRMMLEGRDYEGYRSRRGR